jgi:hypothetical protein
MVNKGIYISCPIAVSQSTFDEYIDLINDHNGFMARYWKRGGEYSQTYFDQSDAFVFILPDNKFKAANYELPIGLKRELARAYELGKKIFIGYQIKSGDYAFYSARTNGHYIEGVPGTTHEIYNLVDSDVVTTKYDPTTFEETTYLNGEKVSTDTKYTFDERALLMLA